MGQDCCSNREPTDKDGNPKDAKKKDGQALELIRNSKNAKSPNASPNKNGSVNPNEAQGTAAEKAKAKLAEAGAALKNYDYKGAADAAKNYDYKKKATETKEAALAIDYKAHAQKAADAVKNHDYQATANAVKSYDYKGKWENVKNHEHTINAITKMKTMKDQAKGKYDEYQKNKENSAGAANPSGNA